MKKLLGLTLLFPLIAVAADTDYTLVIEDHRFQPAELTVPSGKKIKLRVENRDTTPEEFESHVLNREKVIPGNGAAALHIGPLKPGRYPFMGEFHSATAQGVVLAK